MWTLVDRFCKTVHVPLAVDSKIRHYISIVSHHANLCHHHIASEKFKNAALIVLNSLHEYALPHLRGVHVYRNTGSPSMKFGCLHISNMQWLSQWYPLYKVSTIHKLSCLLCISIHQCFPPPYPQHIHHTRSTESCNSWSLLSHHQETLQELTRGLRVPVLPLQTAMSLHQWVCTSVSHPSGPLDCASHDPHKDQVASSRVLVSYISLGHGSLVSSLIPRP